MNALILKPAASVLSDLKAGLWTALATFAAASAVANAVENHRKPQTADLKQLGIDDAEFNLNY